jgi:hypothetical protein
MPTQTTKKAPPPLTVVEAGRRGGAKNTRAQVKARARNAKLAGRPRRVCAECGLPVYGGHKDASQNVSCHGRGWTWQKQSEKPGRR